jgi:hypothetical protein
MADGPNPACSSVGRRFRSYGSVLDIRAGSPQLLERLVARLPPFARPTTSRGEPHLLMSLRDAGPCACGDSHPVPVLYRWGTEVTGALDELLALFYQQVKFYVARRTPDRVFVHAGVVGWRGRAILMPGASMSGKTSLTVALVNAGATYYSDEYAVIDERGLVHPFPQDLGLRSSTGPEQHLTSARSLGWVAGTTPLPVGLVVLAPYRAGAWRVRALTRARGLLQLLPHTVQHLDHPERVLSSVGTAVASATFLKGLRGDATVASRRILDFR